MAARAAPGSPLFADGVPSAVQMASYGGEWRYRATRGACSGESGCAASVSGRRRSDSAADTELLRFPSCDEL